MASLIDENCHELLRNINFSDHNISNNGQHVYSHCHGHREHVQQDKLFMEQEFTTFGVHEKQARKNIKMSKNHKKNEKDISKTKDSKKICKNESSESLDIHVETTDDDADIEIIFFVQNGEDIMRIGVVSKSYLPLENQTILAASFKVQDDTNFDYNSKKHDFDNYKIVKDEDIANKDKEIFTTPNQSTNVSKAKHVHFQEQSGVSKHVKLQSHKMEKEKEKQEFRAVISVNKCDDSCGQMENFTNTTVSNTSNNGTKVENPSHSKFKSTQKSSSHASLSDSDLQKHSVEKISKKDNIGKKLTEDKKTITILRRDNEIVKNDIIEYGETKDDKKQNLSYQIKQNSGHQVKYNENDTKKQKKVIQSSASHTYTSSSTENDTRNSRRSKSTIDATDAQLIEMKREKERLRKKLSRKKHRRNKQKTPKTDLQIYQKQIETGQLRSMFSRYKTEGLKYLELKELLHKGTFCNKYRACFKNKQVVLSVYDSEIAELINALDMAHMGSSYFVLGFTDCMTGPYGKLWFMSMLHSFGDLKKLLSRDKSRHVIGEKHAQFITAGVLIGVDFLHHNSIVHGNIKPSKVLINALGYPVLTGFVKMTDKTDIEGSEAYTPAYAAPEHLRGNRETPIDIFSVGCMAYEIITGVLPFDGKTRGQTEEKIHKGCRPIYDPELFSFAGEFFIDSCLRKNAKERFWIGVERSNLIYEEWFSTLDWRNLRRQTLRSPILNALQMIDNRATLSWEEKTVQFKWGQVMDVLCPYTPSLQVDEDSTCIN